MIEDLPQFADYHRTVVGFHGTTQKRAEEIVLSGEFKASENDYDWLGHGIYFWEYAPKQAWQWARTRFEDGDDIAVVGAMIRLGNCLDLLDPDNLQIVKNAHQLLQDFAGEDLPENRNSRKYLDCAVFQYLHRMIDEHGQTPVDTSRAVYVPTGQDKRVWTRSWLYEQTHIQLCVTNAKNILGAWLVFPESNHE